MPRILTRIVRRTVPRGLRRRLRDRGFAAWPPRGTLRFGSLRRTRPISSSFGFDRGKPVDRHYLEGFLRKHSHDIGGRVLEVGDDRYTRMFGGGMVERVDVLSLDPTGLQGEIIDDLAHPKQLTKATYDCVICAQTLHLIYDLPTAVATLHNVLRPGGVALVTVPGISRICSDDRESWDDYWRFTRASAMRLFGDVFGRENVEVLGYGNVLSSLGFLHGIAAEELRREELDVRDDAYDLLVGVRARRDERP